jgi:VIT1/CCC1 family predicted Fe2+/Mn2+ transporter
MSDGADDELRSAYLYRVIAEREKGTAREALFRDLAGSAETQAAIWADKSGVPLPGFRPDLRTLLVAMLVRRFGPRYVRGVLTAMKVRGMSIYTHPAPGYTRRAPGHIHPAPEHRVPVAGEGVESRHEGVTTGGNMRAAVFGVSDGLISNLSLILGVAGASSSNAYILLSGIAGLLAGAFSMAAGEWVSVRSQREMYEHQIGLERDELDEYPEEEAQELALVYSARGMDKGDALNMARREIADPERALDTLAREELGLNPQELGSPWGASASSFISFAAGAMVPVLPFLVLKGTAALSAAVVVTGMALFGVGAAISLFTGRGAARTGLRMLLIGAGAGAGTYAIGRLLDVGLC